MRRNNSKEDEKKKHGTCRQKAQNKVVGLNSISHTHAHTHPRNYVKGTWTKVLLKVYNVLFSH